MNASQIQKTIRALADPERVKKSMRFFKTGKGEYGENDKFLGISNPVLRAQAAKLDDTSLEQTLVLLMSPYHEERLLALFMMVRRFGKADELEQETIYKKYMANLKYINNWDLVDSSAYQIVGRYLFKRDRSALYKLARSPSMWARRIAIVSTYYFIKNHDYKDVLALSKILINDKEDLIHKAVGWMLREAGNRDRATETGFLKKFYVDMPRTMLRYAIEKYPETERQKFLKGLF